MYTYAQDGRLHAAADSRSGSGVSGADVASSAAGDGPADDALLLVRLQRLRTLDRQRVPLELILILEQMQRATLDVQDRYRMMRTLEESVLRVAAALDERRDGASSAPVGQRLGLSMEQRLYAAMSRGCVQLLYALDRGQGFFSEQNAQARAWAIQASFRFFSRELLFSVKTRRHWPAGGWAGLHGLFVYLVMRGSVRLNPESERPPAADLDPELAYKRLVLIGLAADLIGCEHIDSQVVTRLRAMAADARLVASDGLVGTRGLILVEVGRDCPARLKVDRLAGPFRGWVLQLPREFHPLLRSLAPSREYGG